MKNARRRKGAWLRPKGDLADDGEREGLVGNGRVGRRRRPGYDPNTSLFWQLWGPLCGTAAVAGAFVLFVQWYAAGIKAAAAAKRAAAAAGGT